jgi:hypothetical protein
MKDPGGAGGLKIRSLYLDRAERQQRIIIRVFGACPGLNWGISVISVS